MSVGYFVDCNGMDPLTSEHRGAHIEYAVFLKHPSFKGQTLVLKGSRSKRLSSDVLSNKIHSWSLLQSKILNFLCTKNVIFP